MDREIITKEINNVLHQVARELEIQSKSDPKDSNATLSRKTTCLAVCNCILTVLAQRLQDANNARRSIIQALQAQKPKGE